MIMPKRLVVCIALSYCISHFSVVACDHSSDGHHHHGHSLRKPTNGTTTIASTASTRRHLQDPLTGREECGFVGLDEAAMAKDLEEFQKWKTEKSTFSGSYNIPVYFHVIEPYANFITDTRINYFMTYLNNAYATSTPFTFELKGKTRTTNQKWSQDGYKYQTDFKTNLKVGGMETLNIYICQEIVAPDGGYYAGFSYFPTSSILDGVVIAESSTRVDSRPNTLVHETGHYLGLPHTFNDQNTCDPDGDGIDDTPRMISQPDLTNCKTTDPNLKDTCPTYPGLDPVDNYMTYSNDNSCRTKFTTGQVNKMKYTFETYRYSATGGGGGGVDGGTGSLGTGGNCFSGHNVVDVLGKGLVPLRTIKVGDYVRGRDEMFNRVTSLGHIDNEVEASYLQIHADGLKVPLEVTSSHMLYISDNIALASQVKVGDMLGKHRVTKIKTVKHRGVYAPVTFSGDILVSGVLASCYVSLLDGVSPRLQNPASHAIMSMHRLMCRFDFGLCENETYTDGISDWLAVAIGVVKRVDEWHPRLQISAFVTAIPVISFVYFAEMSVLVSILMFAFSVIQFITRNFQYLKPKRFLILI